MEDPMASLTFRYSNIDGPRVDVGVSVPFDPNDFIGRPDVVVMHQKLEHITQTIKHQLADEMKRACASARRHFEQENV
jgi:hypothetical protein